MLESGLYEGSAKSSLMIPYMEAIQRRMQKKGWTMEQLDAIQVIALWVMRLLETMCLILRKQTMISFASWAVRQRLLASDDCMPQFEQYCFLTPAVSAGS